MCLCSYASAYAHASGPASVAAPVLLLLLLLLLAYHWSPAAAVCCCFPTAGQKPVVGWYCFCRCRCWFCCCFWLAVGRLLHVAAACCRCCCLLQMLLMVYYRLPVAAANHCCNSEGMFSCAGHTQYQWLPRVRLKPECCRMCSIHECTRVYARIYVKCKIKRHVQQISMRRSIIISVRLIIITVVVS